MDRTDARAVYGVDLVSSFYGPGSWTAWLLLVLSTFRDKIFEVERENETGKSHILVSISTSPAPLHTQSSPQLTYWPIATATSTMT